MGCDIHLHIEIMLDGEWHHYQAPYVRRNYAFFGLLAGVRGGDALYLPRGLPVDATKVTRFDRMQETGHTDSYLQANEVKELSKAWKKLLGADYDYAKNSFAGGMIPGYFFHNEYSMACAPKGVTDFRWVFWFDN